MKALFAGLILALAAPALAQQGAAWRPVDAATGQIADIAELEQLARDFPDSASVRLRLFNAQLAAGEAAAALTSLAWLEARGHVFSQRAQAQIPDLIGAAHAEAARALLRPTAEVIAASTEFDQLSGAAGLVESVLVLPEGKGAIASSVSRRAVFVRAPGSDWRERMVPGANALSGLALAPDGGTVWVASANIDGAPDGAERFAGLIGLNGNAANPQHISAPGGVTVSDIVVGPDGTIFASDPVGGGIYHARPDAAQLTELVAPGTFRSPQGLAVSADGQELYVSDYRYGLAMIDLASGTVSRLAIDVAAALDGIDGLWRYRNGLIAVQNGTAPMRISSFALSADGTRIIGHRVLEQAHPEWTEPLGGSIVGDTLYYVATGQWDRYDKGALREGTAASPTVIRSLPLTP